MKLNKKSEIDKVKRREADVLSVRHKYLSTAKIISVHLLVDVVALVLAYATAYGLAWSLSRAWDQFSPPILFAGANAWLPATLFIPVNIFFVYLFGAGKIRWRYTSTSDIIHLLLGTFVSFIFILLVTQTFMEGIKISFLVLFWIVSTIYMGAVRFFNRFYNFLRHLARSKKLLGKAKVKHAIVFGAGWVGRMFAEQLMNNQDEQYIPVAFIDDDPLKTGMTISSIPVLGGRDCLADVVKRTHAEIIVIAIQRTTKKILKEIFLACKETGLPVKIVPSMVDGQKEFSTLALEVRDVKTEELLGREEFAVNIDLINHSIRGKTVLVTGGAGSIGSELCRQALEFECEHLIVYDVTENSVFFLNQEFAQKHDPSRYTLVIGSVRDKAKLKSTFDRFKPDIVFHAAAYKHVPMMEFSPVEAVKNNVMGTMNVIDQCNDSGVKRFVLISTDKAVNPANIMGASKRLAEMVVQTKSKTSKTLLAAVRFGNVLGSAGSVVGIFLDQIRKGGPVTLTHRDIKRYFMTIPEACRLVMQAGALAQNGEVFVLDMGEPVYIYDLATDLIKMNGLVPEQDIEIKVTGLRPGEKLFEELRYDGESVDTTMHEGIFTCKLQEVDADKFAVQLDSLAVAVKKEDQELMAARMFEIVPSVARTNNVKVNPLPDGENQTNGDAVSTRNQADNTDSDNEIKL